MNYILNLHFSCKNEQKKHRTFILCLPHIFKTTYSLYLHPIHASPSGLFNPTFALKPDISKTSFSRYLCSANVSVHPSVFGTTLCFHPLLYVRIRFLRYWISLRPISSSQLHVLPHFHLCPIYLVFFKGSWDISS